MYDSMYTSVVTQGSLELRPALCSNCVNVSSNEEVEYKGKGME